MNKARRTYGRDIAMKIYRVNHSLASRLRRRHATTRGMHDLNDTAAHVEDNAIDTLTGCEYGTFSCLNEARGRSSSAQAATSGSSEAK